MAVSIYSHIIPVIDCRSCCRFSVIWARGAEERSISGAVAYKQYADWCERLL
jgi:hypothetical protein